MFEILLANKLVRIITIILVAFLVNKSIQYLIKRTLSKELKLYKSKRKRAETLIVVFGGTTNFLVSIIAILLILSELGINITALLAGIGVLSLAIGMASREIIADFIAGVFIIIEEQYSIGDWVKIGAVEGIVKEITLRKTIIEDDNKIMHSIPNGQIKVVAKKS
jgi:small conductance mechanosensitive channel